MSAAQSSAQSAPVGRTCKACGLAKDIAGPDARKRGMCWCGMEATDDDR